jgi:septum formation protein
MRLILASASPRRADLLRAAGYAFETIVTSVDEWQRPGETPSAYVRRLAAEKSAAALAIIAGPAKAGHYRSSPADAGHYRSSPADAGHYRSSPADAGHYRSSPADAGHYLSDFVVVGADTAVVVDGEVLGKPGDDAEAAGMLRRLSGRAHEVLTGISVRNSASEAGRVATTAVSFAPLSDADVAWYVAGGEGRDKAGAYAIQGLASRFASVIQGSYSNVVGLPMEALAALLTEIRR